MPFRHFRHLFHEIVEIYASIIKKFPKNCQEKVSKVPFGHFRHFFEESEPFQKVPEVPSRHFRHLFREISKIYGNIMKISGNFLGKSA